MARLSPELGREHDREARNAAVAAHALSLLTGPFGPLLVLDKATEDQPFARFHATQAAIYGAIAAPLTILTLGAALVVLGPLALYALLRASCGEWYAYPAIGRLAAR